jgi:enamine deaminase RidA (YjgF/YER057c/UK114 family)
LAETGFIRLIIPGEKYMSIERKKVGPRLSQAVVHGDTVYLAGIVADHPIPEVAAQTGQILDQIDKLLAECRWYKLTVIGSALPTR